MYEAKERQKFISDAQYLREMQHKMDSEYQVIHYISVSLFSYKEHEPEVVFPKLNIRGWGY